MTAAAKKPTRSHLSVVPNLEEMERVLVEAAAQQAPMLSRSSTTREKMEAAVKALEGELDGVRARRDLSRRHAAALDTGFQSEEDDINRAIALHTGGLTGDTLSAA